VRDEVAEPGTRDRLLEATIAVINESGEAAVRIDAIAAAARITKPSIYHFFGDREGLIIAAQAERLRRALRFGQAEIVERASECTTKDQYAELLISGVTLFATPEGRERRRTRLEVLGSAATRPRLKAIVDQVFTDAADDLAVLFDVGRERGWVTATVSSRALAIWWYGALLSRYLAESNDAFDDAEWAAIMVDVMPYIAFGDTRTA
jgi:AcrR family transcriptional regulator